MWESCTFINNSAANKAAWPQYPGQAQLQALPGSIPNTDAGCGGAFYVRGAFLQLLDRSVARGNTALYGTCQAARPRAPHGQHDAWPGVRWRKTIWVQLFTNYMAARVRNPGWKGPSPIHKPRASGPASHTERHVPFLASSYPTHCARHCSYSSTHGVLTGSNRICPHCRWRRSLDHRKTSRADYGCNYGWHALTAVFT